MIFLFSGSQSICADYSLHSQAFICVMDSIGHIFSWEKERAMIGRAHNVLTVFKWKLVLLILTFVSDEFWNVFISFKLVLLSSSMYIYYIVEVFGSAQVVTLVAACVLLEIDGSFSFISYFHVTTKEWFRISDLTHEKSRRHFGFCSL